MRAIFTWIGGSTWVLEINGLRVAGDPALAPKGAVADFGWFRARRLDDPVLDDDALANIDLWLVTHGHADHLDDVGLRFIGPDATVIAHPSAGTRLRRIDAPVRFLKPGEQTRLRLSSAECAIEAIPTVHGERRLSAWAAGRGNGYWLDAALPQGKAAVYVTGDTVDHPRLLRALAGRKADLVIAHVGGAGTAWTGTLTLNAAMLDRLLTALPAAMVIPIHFGTFSHWRQPGAALESLQRPALTILRPGERREIHWPPGA